MLSLLSFFVLNNLGPKKDNFSMLRSSFFETYGIFVLFLM